MESTATSRFDSVKAVNLYLGYGNTGKPMSVIVPSMTPPFSMPRPRRKLVIKTVRKCLFFVSIDSIITGALTQHFVNVKNITQSG